MATTLIRVDRNGTKYFMSDECPKCGGTGFIDGYAHVEGGICFLCHGTGFHEHQWKEMTPEHAQKLADRRLARERAKADEINHKFFAKEGFSAEGQTWIVLGDTYSIREELKEAGAKYNGLLGWHFDHEAENTIQIGAEDICEKSEAGIYYYGDLSAIRETLESLKEQNTPKQGEWVGTEGEKITSKVMLIGLHTYTTHYTFSGETHIIYQFKDEDGNILIWNTQSWQDVEEGKEYILKGKVKEHGEYKGTKQTVLTRCRVEEA